MSEQIDERGIDLLSPVWNLLDLTREGRGDWYAELSYPLIELSRQPTVGIA